MLKMSKTTASELVLTHSSSRQYSVWKYKLSLNSIFKFEQYSISKIFKFQNSAAHSPFKLLIVACWDDKGVGFGLVFTECQCKTYFGPRLFIFQKMFIPLNLEAGRHRWRHSKICWFACCNTTVRKATQLSLCISQHMTSPSPRERV